MARHNFNLIGNKKPRRLHAPNVRMSFCSALSAIKEGSLNELRAIQEEVCLQIAARLHLRPMVGDTIAFVVDGGITEGTVIRVNKTSVTVLPDCQNPAIRVAYEDIHSSPSGSVSAGKYGKKVAA